MKRLGLTSIPGKLKVSYYNTCMRKPQTLSVSSAATSWNF